tara:strand:- start:286 stop:807 length:522 start_codon:yes stop_codon:yes gene_type:complete
MKSPRLKVLAISTATLLFSSGCAQLDFKLPRDSKALIAAQDTIYNPSELTIPPHTVKWTPVKVPASLSSSAGSAKVLLGVIVLPEGNAVVESIIEKSEGPMAIAAIKAVEQWEFSPGILNGRKVATRIEIPFSYNRAAETLAMDGQSYNNAFQPATFDNTPDINVFEGQFKKD